MGSATLTLSERQSMMEDFLADVLAEHSLERSIKILFGFLSARIPFTQMVGFAIDKRQARLTPWAVLEDGEVVPMFEAIPLHPDELDDAIDMNFVDEERTVFLENDASANIHIARYGDCFMRGKRSSLGAVLYNTPQYRFGINFHATSVDRFTPRHAAIVAAMKKPLTLLVMRFFGDIPQFHALSGRRPVSRTSADVLRLCRGLSEVVQQVEAVAPTGSLVLIQGETGVGKELVADSIHHLSRRRNGPLVKVNCSAMPDSLIDSELFGHEKGAFTSASAMHQGYFEQAHNGTLFLDEIGDLSPGAQARLLRVLETREVQRVGGQRRIPVNVRLIAATHKDLRAMVEAGEFRQDLWYRLLVFPIIVPPLRQRREDILPLARYLYAAKAAELELPSPPALSRNGLEELYLYSWPGNVRQLSHCMERALILAHSRGEAALSFGTSGLDVSTASGAHGTLRSGPAASPTLDEHTALRIREALRESGGRIHGPGGAAEALGVHPNTLRGRMKRLGIPFPRQERKRSR